MDRWFFGALGALTVCTGVSTASIAQDANGDAGQVPASDRTSSSALDVHTSVLDEIVVTAARRRNESAQDTPLAITAVSEMQLQRFRAIDIRDISRFSPNLQINKNLGLQDTAAIYMRGFGVYSDDSMLEPPIAVSIDGVYQPSLYGNMIDLFDASEVEVLRGPQGTLFGKNAATGALSIQTKRPTADRFGVKAQFDYGSYERREARLALNIPLVEDVLAVRLSGGIIRGGNYIKNVNPEGKDGGGSHTDLARFSLSLTPGDRFKAYFTAFYSEDRSPYVGTRSIATNQTYPPYLGVTRICTLYGVCSPYSGPHTTAGTDFGRPHVKRFDATLAMDYEFDPITVSSVSGYKHYNGVNRGDVDGTPFYVISSYDVRQKYEAKSQELRIASRQGGGLDLDGRLDWVVGGYFFDQTFSNYKGNAALGTTINPNSTDGKVRSVALFGHVIFKINDKWNISFGDRQSWDRKSHYFLPAGVLTPGYESGKFKNNSLEVGTQYKFDDTKMIYARYAQGYRGGGFVSNPGTLVAAARFEPETVDSYEIGIKTEWFNRRFRLNVSAFHNQYKDMQQSIIRSVVLPNGATSFFTVTQNAAKARTQGVEVETIIIPVKNLTLQANIAYLDAKFQDYFTTLVGTGAPIDNTPFIAFTYAPKWTFNVGAEYVLDLGGAGSLSFAGNVDYKGKQYLGPNNFKNSFFREDPYTVVNASVRYTDPSERFSLMVYGNNIFSSHYFITKSHSSGLAMEGVEGAPDTYGVRLSVNF